MSPTSTQRDELLDWAVSTGRVPGHKRAAWASLYDRDPVGTTRQIGRMSGGALPSPAASTAPAGPGSRVLGGAGSVWPDVPDGQDRVTLSAGDYRIMRAAAETGMIVSAQRRREQTLGAAASSGRIAQASVGEWRARYNQGPLETARALEQLPEGAHKPAASATAPAAAPAAASASGAAHATRDEQTGDLSFRGFPVAMGASGEPCVFTSSGWMGVAAFAASGLGDEDLRGALVSARLVPSSPTARAFEAGPPGGQGPSDNPLFRGGG